ncbi:MAG: hypothetical protein E6248_14600 [Clostridium sp.]|uniref:hypothetical protein n=1 Tax=Clostridium sp. TaxID=1506 RepID=UPI00290E1A6C|nr:hypothetical protein [Clostridium sp.]MDU5111670.1 hypothetical protein [Clostridium sp.]
MLLNYLTELKKGLSDQEFKVFMKDVDNDIKVNRIQFGKRTSQKEFKEICEIFLGVMDRCPKEVCL